MEWDQHEFAKRLAQSYETRGASDTELAKKLSVSPSTVGRWQTSATNKPSLEVICGLAKALQVRPAWLAFGDEFGEPIDDEELSLITAWRKLPERERATLLEFILVTTSGRTAIKSPGQRSRKAAPLPQPSAVPASAPTKSETLPLSPSELDAILGYLSDVAESGRVEKPLVMAFERLATFLNQQADAQTPKAPAAGDAASSETAGTNESSDATVAPPIARPPT